MSNYRRSKTGHLFFFTLVTWKRRPLFGDPHIRAMLGNILREVRGRYPFENEAFVLMPDHLHAIWRLPDTDYSRRWALIKKTLTRRIRDTSGDPRQEVWQKRFWEHTLRDDRDWGVSWFCWALMDEDSFLFDIFPNWRRDTWHSMTANSLNHPPLCHSGRPTKCQGV